jgi:DNA-binding XRE family transcriptional regulator
LGVLNRIREWRLSGAQMTQAELADACGVTRQTIIALGRGNILRRSNLHSSWRTLLVARSTKFFNTSKKNNRSRTASRCIGLRFAS